MSRKKKILVLIDWFLPGIKAGGPVKSISSMVNILHPWFDFYILTSDRDLGDTKGYPGIQTDKWLDHSNGVQVCYLSPENPVNSAFLSAVHQIDPDFIYINSYFSVNFSIKPLRLIKKIKLSIPVILAPRGMLSAGALKIKPLKKKLFIAYAKTTGLHKHVVWHSTKADETSAIQAIYGTNVKIIEAKNVSDIQLKAPSSNKVKIPNELSLIYLGRIAENKNLLQVLQCLQSIKDGKVNLDIYGSLEDEPYWKKCEAIIESLPENIKINYKGLLKPESISETIRKYHFLILLSYSENFGHAIVEALGNSVPVIISNTTPWSNLLHYNAGWDVAIDSNEEGEFAISQAIKQDQETYNNFARGAYEYAKKRCINDEAIMSLRNLFSN